MPKTTSAAARNSVAKYNAAYTRKKDFAARPNAFLARCLDRITPARRPRRSPRALDIGLGQGRNAVLLAHRGYDVTGIDRSEVGIAAVRRRGRGRITAIVADAERFDYGTNRWDVIALLYYPQPMVLIERLKAAVRPGGYIVVERFTNARKKGANPTDHKEQRRPSPMLRCFLDWRVLHYQNDEFQSDWHWNGQSPTGPMVRILARKPWRG